eukprot:TRINITY_DN16660_c0_g1_i3.p1 TRINITY_DN16660_c0_g1~~TRINITY_DN16660_c0_g1_i3.p1  ORF type:complete len:191 (-),score=49.54 TRINITY_DN16660_c0_g1_i3:219-791(-)
MCIRDRYVDAAKKKRSSEAKKRQAVLSTSAGWTPKIVSALTDLHGCLRSLSWNEVADNIQISELVFPAPLEECALAGAVISLPDWLNSFRQYEGRLSFEQLLLLADQLGISRQLAASPNGGLCYRDESPLFRNTTDIMATSEMELTIERVTAAKQSPARGEAVREGIGVECIEMSVQSAPAEDMSNQDRA